MLLTVAAMMAMVLALTAGPAFAAAGGPAGNAPVGGCPSGSGSNFQQLNTLQTLSPTVKGGPALQVNGPITSTDQSCFKVLPNAPDPLQDLVGQSTVQVVRDDTVQGPK